MKKDGKCSFAEKIVVLWREQSRLGLSAHAAGAGYFMVLSVFPTLVLLLGLLRYTGISVDTLTEAMEGIVPQALLVPAKRMIRNAYRNTSGTVVSLSALIALWSASRGVYGLIRGLNTVYHRQEQRSWLRVRGLSMLYTLLFLLVILAVLIVRVFGSFFAQFLPFGYLLLGSENGDIIRFVLLMLLLTGFFCGVFMVLPDRKNGFLESIPGAFLASAGWLAFSELYSWYVVRFTGYANVFGSVYAVALSLLWLYICLCILFFGGAWNYHRSSQRK